MNGFLKCLFGAGYALLVAHHVLIAAERKAVDSDSPPPAVEKASALLEAGKPEAALQFLDEALKATPRDPWLLYGKAVILSQSGRVQDAVPVVEALFAEQPEKPEFLALYGRILYATGRSQLAVDKLAKATAELQPDSGVLEAFAVACLDVGQPIRAQRALLECIERRAGENVGGTMAAAFAASEVKKDFARLRAERTSLILAYALQNHDSAIGLTRKLMAAGDQASRAAMARSLTLYLDSKPNHVARSVVALCRGAALPEESTKDASLRQLRVATSQAMFTVGCLETNFPAASRKRAALIKTIQNDNVEEDGQIRLKVALKADVDSKLSLGPKSPGGRTDLQAATGAVAALALEIHRQRPEVRRREQPLRLHAETGVFEFEVTSDGDTLTLTRKALPGAEEYEQEFDLNGLPDLLPAPF